jgi:hypothetical protein
MISGGAMATPGTAQAPAKAHVCVSAASGASVAPSKASHIQGHHAQQPSRERGPSRLCGEGGEADLDQSENDRVRGTYAEQRCKAPFGKRPEKRRRRAACIHPETARVRMKSSDPANANPAAASTATERRPGDEQRYHERAEYEHELKTRPCAASEDDRPGKRPRQGYGSDRGDR